MTGLGEFRTRFKVVLIPTFLVSLFIYTSFHLIYGDHGILVYVKMRNHLEIVSENYNQVLQKRKSFEMRVRRMRPDAVDSDMLDEQARVLLGKAHQRDLVIRDF